MILEMTIHFCWEIQENYTEFWFVDISNMGNLMTKCVCGNPEFEDQNINKDSDSGQKNESIIQKEGNW